MVALCEKSLTLSSVKWHHWPRTIHFPPARGKVPWDELVVFQQAPHSHSDAEAQLLLGIPLVQVYFHDRPQCLSHGALQEQQVKSDYKTDFGCLGV